MNRRLFYTAIAFLGLGLCLPVFANPTNRLPQPPELEPDMNFWIRVFTEVDSEHGLIHDDRHLNVVYEDISVPKTISRKQRQKLIKKAKKRYKKILLSLASGKRKHLTAEQRRVLKLWPKGVSKRTLRAATKRLRFQLGQADRFRDGWIRSGIWRPFIEETLRKHGVPSELAALPHVESSFNPKAHSHVGAAGLWQFTRSTGRRYMRIDHIVDERLDPFMATEAAARLLKHNYSVTGTWPLAITAYNHGAAGMRRAARKLGTTDIVPILRHYKSRIFGFASRNFYVALLAAAHVDRNAERYFGPLRPKPANRSATVTLTDYVTPESVEKALNITITALKRANPALRRAVWNGDKYIPRGFRLRIDCAYDCDDLEQALARIPKYERYAQQIRDQFHKVRRGQTLSMIAARYGVRMRDLVELNNLRSRDRIRAGQELRLPQPDRKSKAVTLAAAETPAKTKVTPSVSTEGFYKVKAGDSIYTIARRFNLKATELLSLNKIENKNRIYVGQKLQLASLTMPDGTKAAHLAGLPANEPEEPQNLTDPIESDSDSDETPAEADLVELASTESLDPEDPSEAESLVSEDTETLGPALPSELHPELSADPSDYTVASDGTIEVQAAETLGHYADWLELRTQRLRQINKLRFHTPVEIGERLKLDFSRIAPEIFETRRTAYHRELQSDFFKKYQIADTQLHRVRRGESLWVLTRRKYNVPLWLFRQYNPDLSLNAIHEGMKLTFPRIIERRETAPAKQIPTQVDSGDNEV
jgi:membrane-bound lytic murein transglycosylase D